MAVLLFFIAPLHLSSAEPHVLQYLNTAITPGIRFPEFTAISLFDGQQFVYYDSNIRKMIPKTEWIQKIRADDSDYWEREIQKHLHDQETFIFYLGNVMEDFNQTEGVHTLQRMYSCEIDVNGTTRGYEQYAYNREDFFSLDLNTGTWTAAKPRALIFIKTWDPTGHEAKYRKNYLETECIDRLKKFMSYSRRTLDKEVPPTVSLFKRNTFSPEVVCHATGFFPKALNISWQKDGEDVHEYVDLRETLPNQDGSFQKRSILKVSAEELQKHTYTCVIEHSSLEKEMVLEESKGGRSDEGQIGIGIILIVVSLVLFGLVAKILRRRRGGGRRI